MLVGRAILQACPFLARGHEYVGFIEKGALNFH